MRVRERGTEAARNRCPSCKNSPWAWDGFPWLNKDPKHRGLTLSLGIRLRRWVGLDLITADLSVGVSLKVTHADLSAT